MVTVEKGVNVYRPLPRTKNFIINPEHKTPLNLTIEDVNKRIYSESRNEHHYYGRDEVSQPAYYSNGVPVFYGHRGLRRKGRMMRPRPFGRKRR